jgi:hypothetical protein
LDTLREELLVPKQPHLVLVELLAHASSAAHIVGHLDDRDGSTTLEQLSDHVDALVHGLSELLGDHRLTAEVAPDDDATTQPDPVVQEHAMPLVARIGANGGAS